MLKLLFAMSQKPNAKVIGQRFRHIAEGNKAARKAKTELFKLKKPTYQSEYLTPHNTHKNTNNDEIRTINI